MVALRSSNSQPLGRVWLLANRTRNTGLLEKTEISVSTIFAALRAFLYVFQRAWAPIQDVRMPKRCNSGVLLQRRGDDCQEAMQWGRTPVNWDSVVARTAWLTSCKAFLIPQVAFLSPILPICVSLPKLTHVKPTFFQCPLDTARVRVLAFPGVTDYYWSVQCSLTCQWHSTRQSHRQFHIVAVLRRDAITDVEIPIKFRH